MKIKFIFLFLFLFGNGVFCSEEVFEKELTKSLSETLNNFSSEFTNQTNYLNQQINDLNSLMSENNEKTVYSFKLSYDFPIVEIQTTSFTSSEIIRAAANNGELWVVVGANGTIITSSDGKDWTERTSGVASELWSVAYAKGIWVVVGDGGVILTSLDGINWTPRTSGTTTQALYTVSYGDGLFVAAGNNGVLLTSLDTKNWTSRTSSFGTTRITDACYGKDSNGNFIWVAVGLNGKNATSSNGINWTQNAALFGGGEHIYAVANGNGLFRVGGTFRNHAYSSDGKNWTSVAITVFASDETIWSIVYIDSLWLAVGQGYKAAATYDGDTTGDWTPKDIGFPTGVYNAYNVAYGNEQLIICGQNGHLGYAPFF